MTRILSVIIPTLNEKARIAGTIQALRERGDCEIIVCDGGSTDGTLHQARQADRVLEAPRGRASQQNAGARASRGATLLFLHADCLPPPGFAGAIEQALGDAAVAGGCFQQRIDHPGRVYRWIEAGNAARVRTLGWIYGDQGLFVRRATFDELGGFPNRPLMEDLYFSKRLKHAGRLVILPERLLVSSRRWEQQGVLWQTVRNWLFVGLAHGGVSSETLAGWYPHVRESNRDRCPG